MNRLPRITPDPGDVVEACAIGGLESHDQKHRGRTQKRCENA